MRRTERLPTGSDCVLNLRRAWNPLRAGTHPISICTSENGCTSEECIMIYTTLYSLPTERNVPWYTRSTVQLVYSYLPTTHQDGVVNHDFNRTYQEQNLPPDQNEFANNSWVGSGIQEMCCHDVFLSTMMCCHETWPLVDGTIENHLSASCAHALVAHALVPIGRYQC